MNLIKYLPIGFRIYHKNLKRVEKLFLNIFIIDVLGYSFLFISYLLSTNKFNYNFTSILLIIFPIASGFVTFQNKTILHGIVLLIVHMFPIIVGISLFHAQYNVCNEGDGGVDDCVFVPNTVSYTFATILLSFLILLQTLYTWFLYLLWKDGVWPLIHEFQLTKNEAIKEMYKVYQVQLPIFHAKLMIVGLWLAFYLSTELSQSILVAREGGSSNQSLFHYILPFDCLFFFYSIYTVKGVRDESKLYVSIVYIGNLIQAIFLFSATFDYCTQWLYKNVQECVSYSLFFDVYLIFACLGSIVLGLSTWNTIRCQRNFGKDLGFYITYEPRPTEFNYGKSLMKREFYV